MLTATIALSPTEAEISDDAELMRKIDDLRVQPSGLPRARPAQPRADDNPNFRPTLRQ